MNLAPALGKALLFVLTTAVLFLSPLLASAGESPKRVLIFASEEQQGPGVFLVNQSIRSTLRNGRPAAFLFFYEALDSFRISTEKYEGELVRLLQRKYDGERFDLIYPVGAAALRFLLKHRGELFTDTPVIYVVVDQRQAANLDLGPNVTGVGGKMELAPTLDIALALQPQTQRVVVVAGNASADNTYVALARQEFRPYEGKVEFTYLINLPIEELQKRLAALPEKSVVFYLSVNSDPTTRIYTSPEVLARLAPSSSVPIYAASQIYIGNGTIGGRLLNLEEIGNRAAEIGLRILAGESPQNMPPQTIPSTPMFDWRELRRWGISEQRLPPGSIVRYKEFSVWELYKWRIVGAIALIVLQALGIVWLLFTRAKRRQAEEAKNNLATIVETSDDAILSETLEGIITSWNAGAEKIYGYTASEIVGQHVSILAPAELKSETQGIIEGLRSGENVDHLETVRVSKDGIRIDVSLTISPIKNERGIIMGASTIARDITARKKAEAEELEHRTELAHLSRVTMLGELSGSLAHELNQPLTAILSNAQAAQRFLAHDDVDLNEVRDILGDIVNQDKRAGEVIHRLRLLLKKSTAEHQPLDLNDVVSEVLKLVRNELLNHRVTGQMELAPELPAIVGDRVQLQQVVLNLVMNGCDAIAGGPAGDRKLIIRTEMNNGEGICVSVADRGVGLAPDNLEKVFEPFFSTKPHGMGLGLSVCRTIIDAHGGKLWAANNAERGTTFYFTIPVKPELRS
jgi:PAS domain S-box-containing protein